MAEGIVELYGAAQIAERVETLAADISRAYAGRELTVLGVVEDGFMFLADLLRRLDVPLRTSFLRYDHRSLGGVQDLNFSTPLDLARRDVLLVEGVLETGVTQEYLIKQLESRGAATVKLCVLVDKVDSHRVELKPDWCAFETGEHYVFGYGLGMNDRWRNLPYLARPA
ncbi:MAG: hypoxanthine phosphoribosyltransferase [Pyrinomonadaceae bacterium]|nr:hypoxanthine phosphoribosyltransferase [Pyrinomonadaceae bacterium]MDX6269428.1 hypoxanthine phosphoribosyltransferase [Acidobacteriota bacterium]